MSENRILFDSVIFDKEDKTFTIVDGSIGVYSFYDVKKCEIINEDAKVHGKGEPFSRRVMGNGMHYGPSFGMVNAFADRAFYVGILLILKDGKKLAIYISKKATYQNTTLHIKDKEEARKIKRLFLKIIEKYKEKEC